MAKKPAGIMRIALMKRMAPKDEVAPDNLEVEGEGFPPEKGLEMPGAVEAGAPGEGSYEDALNELTSCVNELPQDKQAEASKLIDQLKSLFEEKEAPEEEIPSETAKGPETGNANTDTGSY